MFMFMIIVGVMVKYVIMDMWLTPLQAKSRYKSSKISCLVRYG